MGGRIVSAALAVMFATMAPLAAQANDASVDAVTAPTLNAAQVRPAAAPATAIPETMASDRILGNPNAPVTIIEYASFTCSHCAVFNNTVLPQIKARFIDTGKARLIFRDLPTPPLQVSASLAALARCSAPDRFYDVTKYLFEGQEAAFANQDLTGWMRGAIAHSGRTEAQLTQCLGDEQTRVNLTNDIETARAAGVNSTPTIYVNGQRVPQATLESVVAAITPLVQ